jgi:hypothetical protein
VDPDGVGHALRADLSAVGYEAEEELWSPAG